MDKHCDFGRKTVLIEGDLSLYRRKTIIIGELSLILVVTKTCGEMTVTSNSNVYLG